MTKTDHAEHAIAHLSERLTVELTAGLGGMTAEWSPGLPERLTDSEPDPLWWRVAITEPGARTVEVDALRLERGRLASLCRALPRPWMRRDADRWASEASRAPVNLEEALAAACEGVEGITPAQFRSLISPEDITDIEAGDIHPGSGRLVPLARTKP